MDEMVHLFSKITVIWLLYYHNYNPGKVSIIGRQPIIITAPPFKWMFTLVGKYLFKVSKITLEQRPYGRCSNVILADFEQIFAHWVKQMNGE